MSAEPTAECHCLIADPRRPRILALASTNGVRLPTVSVSALRYDYEAPAIARTLWERHGVLARILRLLHRRGNQLWLELEFVRHATRQPEPATWIERSRYEQAVQAPDAGTDPVRQWFEERDESTATVERQPWQIPGWFAEAEAWIERQLAERGIRPTAPVTQFRAGWDPSCVLVVRTERGWVYFKAGPSPAPREADIVSQLATDWPGTVVKPLAADSARNWMLNADYFGVGVGLRDPGALPECVERLAAIQRQAASERPRWEAAGCPVIRVAELGEFYAAPGRLAELLDAGERPLEAAERNALEPLLAGIADDARALAERPESISLVHTDFRDDNLILMPDGPRIIDWADTVLAHPLFAAARIMIDHDYGTLGTPLPPGVMPIGKPHFEQIRERWLAGLADPDDIPGLRADWERIRRLAQPWHILLLARRYQAAGPHPSVETARIPTQIQARVRWMMRLAAARAKAPEAPSPEQRSET